MPRRRAYGVKFTKEEFRRDFPRLGEELEGRVMHAPAGGVRWERGDDEAELKCPDALSYLRRCSTVDEAEEIIAYLAQKGEISREYADKLRRQARDEGPTSFGERKERGYYFRKYYAKRRAAEMDRRIPTSTR